MTIVIGPHVAIANAAAATISSATAVIDAVQTAVLLPCCLLLLRGGGVPLHPKRSESILLDLVMYPRDDKVEGNVALSVANFNIHLRGVDMQQRADDLVNVIGCHETRAVEGDEALLVADGAGSWMDG